MPQDLETENFGSDRLPGISEGDAMFELTKSELYFYSYINRLTRS